MQQISAQSPLCPTCFTDFQHLGWVSLATQGFFEFLAAHAGGVFQFACASAARVIWRTSKCARHEECNCDMCGNNALITSTMPEADDLLSALVKHNLETPSSEWPWFVTAAVLLSMHPVTWKSKFFEFVYDVSVLWWTIHRPTCASPAPHPAGVALVGRSHCSYCLRCSPWNRPVEKRCVLLRCVDFGLLAGRC